MGLEFIGGHTGQAVPEGARVLGEGHQHRQNYFYLTTEKFLQ